MWTMYAGPSVPFLRANTNTYYITLSPRKCMSHLPIYPRHLNERDFGSHANPTGGCTGEKTSHEGIDRTNNTLIGHLTRYYWAKEQQNFQHCHTRNEEGWGRGQFKTINSPDRGLRRPWVSVQSTLCNCKTGVSKKQVRYGGSCSPEP